MKNHLRAFDAFLKEAVDPSYYQETFYFTILLSMLKEKGGSRDETKNDIRALPEVLTVTLIEPERGGIQRDIGTKYLTSLKLHVRLPKNVNKRKMMKMLVNRVDALRGVSVLRYREHRPRERRKPFRGALSITEGDYYQSPQHARDVVGDAAELTGHGPQKKGGAPFDRKTKKRSGSLRLPEHLAGAPHLLRDLRKKLKYA